ncbi:beta-lactamase family protein [Agromyces intestinalis]|uniref:Beta-lactamase family protein n=1 Tax=Agromyces intestinalis TaxID=2592652 RepID=A0A5C1YHR0_9MICO|nr:serine hydrolase domain-containing protein [Agromyces intestinalis]QEO14950.1 beta-lactamase family protein [Agromyces intestinalis]
MSESSTAAPADLATLIEHGARDGVYSAATLLIAVDGEIVEEHAAGITRRWDAPGIEASSPGSKTDASTRFDLASITKLVTAATLLGLIDERGADPSLPAAEVLPEFAADPALRAITLRHLLSHTAGMPPEWFDREADAGAVRFRAGARPTAAPDTVHAYSCVSYIWAGLAAEAIGGEPLDRLARRLVLDPLGMTETGYRPDPALVPRIAATEYQAEPPRGLVHGVVHDETAWALGGVVGNAGLFGTARDLLRLAEALRLPPGDSALPAAVVRWMTTPVDVPGEPGYRQALGPRLDDAWTAAWTSPAGVAGHTGYTGTAVATEPGGRRSVVFLTNRVHPERTSLEILALRRQIAAAVAERGESR